MAREVLAPDGRKWRVRRRWLGRDLPGWRRVRPDREGGSDWGGWDLFGDDWLAGVAVGLVVAAVLAAFVLLVIPAVVFLVEVLVAVALGAIAVAGRVLLRRPWIVEAESGEDHLRWPVVGWRASGRAVETAAEALQRGQDPRQALTA